MFDLNKNNWPEYQFSEIAEQISERIDPAESNAEIYVGLEHIKPNSIHIKEHGKPSDVKGTKLKVYKGDIIFGKRRAYQRKAAIADFDGICSAHAMVLRAKPKVMIPELFAFFLHSDVFMNRAIDISEGSLSPTIKWKILAKQKFTIPPLDEQKKLADLLWAGDKLLQHYTESMDTIEKYRNSILLNNFFRTNSGNTDSKEVFIASPFQTKKIKKEIPKDWREVEIQSIVREWQNGFAEGKRDDDGVRQLRMNNITSEFNIDLKEIIRVPKRKNFEKYLMKDNDILFNNTNSPELVGKSILVKNLPYEMTFSNHFTRIRIKNNLVLPDYFYYWLFINFKIGLFQARCTRWVNQAAIQTSELFKLKMLLPPIEQQKHIINILTQLDSSINDTESTQTKMKKIIKFLNLRIFS